MESITVGILFSDVAGFSKLSQPELETYSKTILPELKKSVIDSHQGHLKKTNTWGDAIMLVSNDVPELARLALGLRDFYKNKNWPTQSIGQNLSVRIALHVDTLSQGPNTILGEDDVFGRGLTVAARIEPVVPPNMIYTTEQFQRHIGDNDPIIKFDDLGNVPLAKDAGERPLFHLRREGESPAEPIRRKIQVTPWCESGVLPDENAQIIQKRLRRCKEGEVIRFIAMVGRNVMLPPAMYQRGVKLIDLPFPKALSKGVKFQGILLDPESEDAEFRSEKETPGEPLQNRLLYRDANFLKENLHREYSKDKELKGKIQNLELRYTKIGLGFSLWLFDDVAFMEPYHFGKKKNRRNLRGFSQLEIPESTFEYERMETHFDVLWENSISPSSARDRLLAVRKSGPRLSPEDAEMLNRVIQEARDASMPEKLPT